MTLAQPVRESYITTRGRQPTMGGEEPTGSSPHAFRERG
jgi:hypothetical protein